MCEFNKTNDIFWGEYNKSVKIVINKIRSIGMLDRRFGMDVQNIMRQKSSNHIVLKSRSFSFDGKSKVPSHITRRTSFAQEKVKGVQFNKSVVESVVLKDK